MTPEAKVGTTMCFIGACAFAVWQDSFAAGIFAFIFLCAVWDN
jgi:hypothetical protein